MRKQPSTFKLNNIQQANTTTQFSCNKLTSNWAGDGSGKQQEKSFNWCQQQRSRQPKSLLSQDYFQIIENFKSEVTRLRKHEQQQHHQHQKNKYHEEPQKQSYQEQRRLREQQQLLLKEQQKQETEPQYAINDEAKATLNLLYTKPVNEKGSRNIREFEKNHDNYTDNVRWVNINNGSGGHGDDGRFRNNYDDGSRSAIRATITTATSLNNIYQHREQPYSLMAPLEQLQQIQQDHPGRPSHLVNKLEKRNSSHHRSTLAKSFLCLYILQQLASLIYYSISNDFLQSSSSSSSLSTSRKERVGFYRRQFGESRHDGHGASASWLLFALASTTSKEDDQLMIESSKRFDQLLESELRLEDKPQELVRPLDLIRQQYSRTNVAQQQQQPLQTTPGDGDIVSHSEANDQPSLPTATDHKHRQHHQRHHQHSHHHRHPLHHHHRKKAGQHEAAGSSSSGGDRLRRHNNNNDYSDDGGGFFDPSSQSAADRPVVATRKGLIRGITRKSVTGKYVDAFLGIPFAQPPTGRFRFRHPRPINPWPGELDASKLSNSCYQVNDTFFGATFMGTSVWNANTPLNEDCLYLNVWTPFGVANTTVSPPSTTTTTTTTTTTKNNKQQQNNNNNNYHPSPLQGDPQESLPTMTGTRTTSSISGASKPLKRAVLVWIFGGGFYSGSSTLALYDGSALASEEDIIVVSMNYRVSALGFLYFGRPDAPGNAGLFDQLMALQWINDNIDQFGGDPERVTLFGESAGAVSIAFHLLSPLSRNLFNQAILQSGGATCPWGHMDLPEIISNGLQLASLVHCPSNQSDLDSVLECLLKADPVSLVSQEVGQTRNVLNFPFVPVVDGSFLIEPPGESLAKANFKQARILLGSNYDEANAFLIYWPEFSSCPASSSSSSSSSSSASNNHDTPTNTLAPSMSDSATGAGAPDMEPANGGGPDVESSTLLMSELRDQAQPMTDDEDQQQQQQQYQQRQQQIKSLDLVGLGPSGRQSTFSYGKPTAPASSGQHQQSMRASGPNEQQSATALNQQKQQQQQHDRESESAKPCKPIELLSLTREDFFQVLREGLNPYAEHPIGKEAIIFEYSNWNNPQDPVSNYDAIDKIVGDYNFLCHVNEFAQRYAEAGNGVYMYYFKQHSSISPWPKWMGVLHGDEIYFIFGEPLNQIYNYTSKEVELSRRMMKYWANFAKFGDPTKTGHNMSMTEKWPEYGDKKQYFELHSDYIRIGRGPRAKQCAFWADYLPKLIQSFDKGGQCAAKSGNSLLSHPFTSSLSQLQLSHARAAQHHQQHLSFINSIPSGLLISLLVILILAAVGAATYMFCSRHSSATWKLKWPLGSSSAPGNGGGGGGGGGGGSGSGGRGGGANRGGGQTAADPSD